MLFSIIFTINAGIVTYFVYYKYMNHNKEIGAEKGFNYQKTFHYRSYKMATDVKSIDIKNRTYYFFNDMVNIKVFDPN